MPRTALELTLEPAREPRSDAELMAMCVHANEDDDDDDVIFAEYAFVDNHVLHQHHRHRHRPARPPQGRDDGVP